MSSVPKSQARGNMHPRFLEMHDHTNADNVVGKIAFPCKFLKEYLQCMPATRFQVVQDNHPWRRRTTRMDHHGYSYSALSVCGLLERDGYLLPCGTPAIGNLQGMALFGLFNYHV